MNNIARNRIKKIIIVSVEILIFCGISIYVTAYNYSGYCWAGNSATYYTDIQWPSWLQAIDTAAATWNGVNPNSFSFKNGASHYRTTNADDFHPVPDEHCISMIDYGKLSSDTTKNQDYNPVAMTCLQRTYEGILVQCDTRFNEVYTFTTNGNDNRSQNIFDLQTVALHEFGHWLHIADVPDTSAVMYQRYLRKRRSLSQDEINAVNNIYPRIISDWR